MTSYEREKRIESLRGLIVFLVFLLVVAGIFLAAFLLW